MTSIDPYTVGADRPKIACPSYCVCRGGHWPPVSLPQKRIFRDSFLPRQTGAGEQCSPLQELFDSLRVEKACYRKICRDGSISALRAAAVRRLRSETRLRAQ